MLPAIALLAGAVVVRHQALLVLPAVAHLGVADALRGVRAFGFDHGPVHAVFGRLRGVDHEPAVEGVARHREDLLEADERLLVAHRAAGRDLHRLGAAAVLRAVDDHVAGAVLRDLPGVARHAGVSLEVFAEQRAGAAAAGARAACAGGVAGPGAARRAAAARSAAG